MVKFMKIMLSKSKRVGDWKFDSEKSCYSVILPDWQCSSKIKTEKDFREGFCKFNRDTCRLESCSKEEDENIGLIVVSGKRGLSIELFTKGIEVLAKSETSFKYNFVVIAFAVKFLNSESAVYLRSGIEDKLYGTTWTSEISGVAEDFIPDNGEVIEQNYFELQNKRQKEVLAKIIRELPDKGYGVSIETDFYTAEATPQTVRIKVYKDRKEIRGYWLIDHFSEEYFCSAENRILNVLD